ncbi:MAG: ATP-binding protein [Cyclobacteriaceae bacterium]|jgi:predicted AAA+ superfamily ATPase
MLNSVAKSQIIDRIRFENPWWVTGHIEDDYNQMRRRAYFELFKPQAFENDIRRALVLMGPRRVGKTVMLYHLVEELLLAKVPARKIIFLTIENPLYIHKTLEQLFQLGKEASGNTDKNDWYVIFDEIQYCREWEVHLKSLVDSYRQCKFIASGSAAAALKYKSQESGAGRFTDFMLPPLTFHEYVELKDQNHLMVPTSVTWNGNVSAFYTSTHLDELNKHFVNYLNFGGYPEVIFNEKIQSNPGRFIRQDIVDKVLLRDLPSLYGISDVQELNSLFTSITYNTANEFSYEELSQNSGVPKNTLKKYIEYLEAAFLLKQVKRVDQSGKRFLRDNFFKLYLTNPSMRSALFSPLTATDDQMGNMVETAIYAQWMHREWFTPYYARWNGGEVDMIGIDEKNLKPNWALEIKWSNRYFEKTQELKSLVKFCTESGLDKALVTTIDKEGTKTEGNCTLQFFPAAAYAYTVGKNTLVRKKTK